MPRARVSSARTRPGAVRYDRRFARERSFERESGAIIFTGGVQKDFGSGEHVSPRDACRKIGFEQTPVEIKRAVKLGELRVNRFA